MRITYAPIRGAAVALVALLAVAGCGQRVAGEGVPDPTQIEPLPASTAFGDFPTVDPCTYTEVAAFHDQSAHVMEVTLDSCEYRLDIKDAPVKVVVGPLRYTEDFLGEHPEERSLGRGVKLLRSPKAEFGTAMLLGQDALPRCVKHVTFPDGVAVSLVAVTLSTKGGPGEEELCELMTSAARGVYAAAVKGTVQHWEPPKDSAARLAACSLLSADEIADALGVPEVDEVNSPSELRCDWGISSNSTPSVSLDLMSYVKVLDQNKKIKIAGRASRQVSASFHDVGFCAVAVKLRPLALEVDGAKRDEMARLVVRVPPSVKKKPCAVGEKLAARAWRGLPD